MDESILYLLQYVALVAMREPTVVARMDPDVIIETAVALMNGIDQPSACVVDTIKACAEFTV